LCYQGGKNEKENGRMGEWDNGIMGEEETKRLRDNDIINTL